MSKTTTSQTASTPKARKKSGNSRPPSRAKNLEAFYRALTEVTATLENAVAAGHRISCEICPDLLGDQQITINITRVATIAQ